MLANKAREIMEQNKEHNLIKYTNYAKRITETKVKRKAKKGNNTLYLKVPHKFKYAPLSVAFNALGYQTNATYSGKILIIEW